MASKYGDWTRGEEEALLNILGGTEVARNILRGTVKVVTHVITFLTSTHKLVVNYTRSIADSVKAGRYDWVNENITDKNFPSTETGEKEVDTAIYHFNKVTSSEDAIAEMKKDGCRPATMKELLAFGEKHPEEQRKFPIVALGSVVELFGGRRVGCLGRGGSERDLDLGYFGSVWDGGYRFLAVRN